MALSENNPVARAEDQRLSQFIENLTLEDQRALSRLLNRWEKRDQRKHPREKCSIITDYIVDNQNYKGIMLDISPDGAFIASRHLFPVNRIIFQSFFFPELRNSHSVQ